MAAFNAAINLGVDSVETDIVRTRDGVLALHHDLAVSDGRKIADLNYAELPLLPDGSRIPKLFDLLQLAKTRNAHLSLELKEPGYEQAVVDAVSSVLPVSQYDLTSFKSKSIQAVESYRPEVRTGLLQPYMFPWIRETKLWPFIVKLIYNPLHLVTKAAEKAHADFLAVDDATASASMLKDAAEKGIDVDIWTVDTSNDLQKFISDKRVHGVITNQPDLAIKIRTALGFAPKQAKQA